MASVAISFFSFLKDQALKIIPAWFLHGVLSTAKKARSRRNLTEQHNHQALLFLLNN